jgi:hypothetical protein
MLDKKRRNKMKNTAKIDIGGKLPFFTDSQHVYFNYLSQALMSSNNCPENIYIKEVIYANPKTIILWSDGTKTCCKISEGDVYKEEQGLVLCVIKKFMGIKGLHALIKNWVPNNNNSILEEKNVKRVTLKAVRNSLKNKEA